MRKLTTYTEFLNESLNEKKAKPVTRKSWAKLSDDDQLDILLTVFKDPDDAEDWVGKDFDLIPDAEAANMMHESLNEKSSADNALLQKMFKALKKSKNFKSIKMTKPYSEDDWDGAVIKIMSNLYGEDRHKNDLDVFEIGVDHDGGIVIHYVPSGGESEIDSVAQAIMMTRADKKVDESLDEGLTPMAADFLDAVQVSDNKIKNLKDITVSATDKGNWVVFHKGKNLVTVNGNLLDDKTIMKYGLEHHTNEALKKGDFVSDTNDEEGRVGKIVNLSSGTADIEWNNDDEGESIPVGDLVKTKK